MVLLWEAKCLKLVFPFGKKKKNKKENGALGLILIWESENTQEKEKKKHERMVLLHISVSYQMIRGSNQEALEQRPTTERSFTFPARERVHRTWRNSESAAYPLLSCKKRPAKRRVNSTDPLHFSWCYKKQGRTVLAANMGPLGKNRTQQHYCKHQNKQDCQVFE